MTKVLILVRGGIVQAVHSNNPETKIVIVDYDNLEGNEDGIVNGILNPDRVIDNHWEAFNDENDETDMEVRDELKRLKF